MTFSQKSLSQLKLGQSGRIVSIGSGVVSEAQLISRRLFEMGLVEGEKVEVVREAPFGGDPFAVRVRGGTIALRRQEAEVVRVEGAF